MRRMASGLGQTLLRGVERPALAVHMAVDVATQVASEGTRRLPQ